MSTDRSLLPASWDIPQIFRDRLGVTPGRQRAMVEEDHLLLVLHAPPATDQPEREGRFFWRQPSGQWECITAGKGLNALDKHLDEFEDLVESLDERTAAASTSQALFDQINTLAPVSRSARNLQDTLQTAREAFRDDRDLIRLRDQAYRISRTAELAYQDARNALDFLIARQAEAQARSSYQMAVSAHRLNTLAAFFFPLATLSAIFGVNLAHGLETTMAPAPFLAMVTVSIVCGLLLKAFVVSKPPSPDHENDT
tara:strand:+ start:1562 stop:2326 length:765 start_codon:yes stop_codon:yes gene_type:complete